jgi:hypothetical protein
MLGKFFHVRNTTGEITKQGRILNRVGRHYLIEIFAWHEGGEGGQQLVHPKDMPGSYSFYDTAADMHAAFNQSRQRGRHRQQDHLDHDDVGDHDRTGE